MGRYGFPKPIITGIALALLAVSLLTLPGVNAQALTWTTVTSPTANTLISVYCVNADDCWAVGEFGEIIQWTGSTWATVTTPTANTLSSVFCVGASDCWAVGNLGFTPTKIIQWLGSSWATVTSPSPTSDALSSVYCVSASDCWAVGDAGTIIQWTGSSWATVTSPTSSPLNSVFIDTGWAVGVSGTIIRGDPATTTTTATTVIPEYPLGLPLLAIFMLIAYGLIKRRTRN